MATNFKIEYYGSALDSSPTHTFIFDNSLRFEEEKTQESVNVPFPFLGDRSNLIWSLFGQKRTFRVSFLLMERSDDYTDGTGSDLGFPALYTANEQRRWLQDYVFKPRGYHVLTAPWDLHTEAASMNGRIEQVSIEKNGDDPITWSLVFKFTVGKVASAGQFNIFTS